MIWRNRSFFSNNFVRITFVSNYHVKITAIVKIEIVYVHSRNNMFYHNITHVNTCITQINIVWSLLVDMFIAVGTDPATFSAQALLSFIQINDLHLCQRWTGIFLVHWTSCGGIWATCSRRYLFFVLVFEQEPLVAIDLSPAMVRERNCLCALEQQHSIRYHNIC